MTTQLFVGFLLGWFSLRAAQWGIRTRRRMATPAERAAGKPDWIDR